MSKRRVQPGWSRRKVLATGAAGAALVSVPHFLVGCGGAAAQPTATTPPVGEGVIPIGHFAAFGVDEAVIRRVLDAAMSRGGDYADLFFQHEVTNYVGLQDGEVNQAYSSVSLGCGVRVLKGDQTGFAFTEDLSPEALAAAAQTAAVVAQGAPAEPLAAIQRVDTPSYSTIEVPWKDVGIDRKIPLLQRANERAMGADPRMAKVTVYLSDTTGHVLIANSDGALFDDAQPMTTLSVSCVAEDGDRREDNYHALGLRKGFETYDDATVDDVVDQAVKRCLVQFDASTPPAGEYPVVLAPGMPGILLHEAMGHGFEADFNRKGISVYADKIGTKIAPEFVTIVDDGTNPNGRGTINFDDEGTESQRTVLVDKGVLTSYMHDRISAAHYGVAPTGNGRRQNYKFPPVPRMRNTYMLEGPHDPEEIIKSVDKGVYAETFTNGQVRIGSGDFSFYLKNGYLIEGGKLTQPVKDANLIGFGPEVLEKVAMVGNDVEIIHGGGGCGKDGQRVPVGFGQPTMLCHGISVGGAG